MSDKVERDTAVIIGLLRDSYQDTKAENKRLKDENAKLREQLAEWKRVAESKQDIIDHMRDANAENAKLRELVVRMARALSVGSDWCHRDCCEEFRCTDSCAIAEALIELGIAEYEEDE